jgi:mannose-1-phosphate guanylyltransferase
MNAMILAAGRGTRLGDLGQATAKVLVEVGGEPLLNRQIRYLTDGGIERIVINAHHLADQIEDFVTTHPHAADIEVVVEPHLLGTAGGVRNALHLLGDEAFAVLYGDVIVDEPLTTVTTTHQRAQAEATLTVYRTKAVAGKGTVDIAPNGSVSAFREKAAGSVDGHAYVNAGLYVVDPNLMRDLPVSVPMDFGHHVFPAALAQGRPLAAHVLAAPVIDMGTPAMLEAARHTLG